MNCELQCLVHTVLVTGGRGGIGRAMAEALSLEGFTVIVTVRKEADVAQLQAESERLVPLLMDVTNEDHAATAAGTVSALLAHRNLRLLGVVANAGINPEGDILQDAAKTGEARPNELADMALAQATFDTNVFGVVRTARTFLPLLREGAGGRLILIGSYFGTIAGALGAAHLYYEMSKFALEGLADGLRRDEAKRAAGVKVCLVKPGNIFTAMNPTYGEDGPEVVTAAVRHALRSSTPKHRYYPGRVKGYQAWLMCWVFSHLPTWLSDKLLG